MTTPSERPTRAEVEDYLATRSTVNAMSTRLARIVLEMDAALLEVEWIWHWTEEGEGYSECPWCLALLEDGHKFDCARQLALLP